MTNSKNNSEKQDKTSESSQQDKTESSQQPTKQKERLKFKKEDMYKITYDF